MAKPYYPLKEVLADFIREAMKNEGFDEGALNDILFEAGCKYLEYGEPLESPDFISLADFKIQV